jgi:hypothetical protein
MANENAQGHRYQQRVHSKYQRRHAEIEAIDPNWAEKYRADGQRAAAEKAALKEQEHQATVAGAMPDEEPAALEKVIVTGTITCPDGVQITGNDMVVTAPKEDLALDQAADSATAEMQDAANAATEPKA